MKKLALLSFLIIAIVTSSCTEENNIVEENFFLGQTFEINNVDFELIEEQGDDGEEDFIFQAFVEIPLEIEVFESDAILVYRLEEIVPLNDGTTADAWSLLPVTYFIGEGNADIIQYKYNHTFFDVLLTIDGNFDLDFFTDQEFEDYTQNQVFRFVVVPSDFATNPTVDLNDINAVLGELNITDQ